MFFLRALLSKACNAPFKRLSLPLKRLFATVIVCVISAQSSVAHAFGGDYWGTEGNFSIVTYNIAGLPYFLKSPCTAIPGWQLIGKLPLTPGCFRPDLPNPNETTPEIGRRVARFDVVNVQEDFNYHADLYSTTGQYGYRTATTGGVPLGSGLNTLSYMTVGGLERIRWRNCKDEDCYSTKGFTFQRLMVGKGSYIDMYNLHAQANSDGDSLWVRRDNFRQLADYINWKSAGNAVVIAGDTNMRWTRDGEPIRDFLAETGMVDTYVITQLGGNPPAINDFNRGKVCAKGSESNDCEIVDKIFYRSGDDIDLWVTGYSNEDRNFIYKGQPLSDHRPVAAWFEWKEKAPKFALAAEHSGKCLDIEGNSLGAGAKLIQYDCKDGEFNGNQLFRRIGDTLKVTHSGQCLELPGGSRTVGERVQQWPCNGSNAQKIDFRNNGAQAVFRASGLCVNVDRASRNNEAAIIQWACENKANDRFSWKYWQ